MAVYNKNGISIAGTSNSGIANLSNYGDLSDANGFEAAWAAAIADDSISGISIPYGSYDTNHTLSLRSDFCVYGNGATLHIRGSNINAFLLKEISNVVIDELHVAMHQTINTTMGTTFYIADCNRITIKNLSVYGIAVRAAMVLNSDMTSTTPGNSKIIFDNLKLVGIGQPNANEPNWPYGLLMVNVRDSVVRNCKITGISRTCIGLKNYVNNCYVVNNHCEDGKHALALASDVADADRVSSDVTFSGNTVKNSEHPLWIGKTERFTVIGNVLHGGQMYIQNVSDAVFNSNVMDNSNQQEQDLIRIDNCNNIMLCDNLYIKNQAGNLFDMVNSPTNIYASGMIDGRKIDVLNPTSGTPAVN